MVKSVIGTQPSVSTTGASGIFQLDEVFGYIAQGLWPITLFDLTYAQEVLLDGPVSYWRLGESSGTTAVDELGSNDGTYGGTPTFGITGALTDDTNTCVTFSGTAEKITLPDIGIGEAPFSVEAWFKRPDNVTTSKIIYSESGGANDVVFCYLGSGGNFTFWINDGTTSVSINSTNTYDDDAWHHSVCTYDGTTMYIYIDGAEAANGARGGGYPTLTTSLIADDARPSPATNYEWGASQDGELDEIAIYDYALTPSQVRRHYYRGLGKVGYELEVLSSGPGRYWRLGESSGTTATDETGGDDGTYIGSPTLGVQGAITESDTAVTFNGSSQGVNMSANADSYLISIELWFKPASTITSASATQALIHLGKLGEAIYLGATSGSISNETLTIADGDSGGGYLTYITSNISTEWHHLVVVDNGSGYDMWLDGIKQSVSTGSSGGRTYNTFQGDGTAPSIGYRNESTGLYFDGSTDEVALYGHQLTETDIRRHYYAGLGKEGYELDILSLGPILWLDADQITAADTDPIGTWTDQSNSTYDATQGTEAYKPLYRTNQINGKPALEFDGINDRFSISMSEAAGNFTWFFVFNPNNASGLPQYLYDSQTGRLVLAALDNNVSNDSPSYYDGAWREAAGTGTTGWQVLEYNLDSSGTSGYIYRNNVELLNAAYTAVALGATQAIGSTYTGASVYFDGMMAEILTFNKALTEGERIRVNNYLEDKYGITL